MSCPVRQLRQAFTLVELLVVIGIISALIGLLLPAVGRARASAQQVRAMSNLRQMLTGYTMYHQANKGALLWGFTNRNVMGWPVQITDPRTGYTTNDLIADRYPWRLLPYCSNVWGIIHSHADLPPIPESAGDPEIWIKCYNLSVDPTFGINAVYLGGSKEFDGFPAVPGTSPAIYRPNVGKHVAFRASEVRRSSQIIVFADAQAANTQNIPELTGKGFHTVTPPYARGQNWKIENGKVVSTKPTLTMGLPKGWFTKYTTVGFFDGHVESMLPADLMDMRMWSPKATSPTWDYAAP